MTKGKVIDLHGCSSPYWKETGLTFKKKILALYCICESDVFFLSFTQNTCDSCVSHHPYSFIFPHVNFNQNADGETSVSLHWENK